MSTASFTNPVPIVDVPDGWRLERIEKLCSRITSGGTPSRQVPEYYENGTIPWFKTKELKDWYLDDSEEHITVAALQNSSAKVFEPGTVLLALYGDGITITSLGILRRPAATNQACCAFIVAPEQANNLFLFYSLKYHRNDLIHLATGGAQRNLSGRLLRNFSIRVPPLLDQQAIACILGALDDKIELNRRRNQTLEAMVREVFRSWFVDFDPVRAKAAGRTPPGLSPDLAALFPDLFNDSPLGPIPKGWELTSLADQITAAKGLSYKGEFLCEPGEGLPMHNLNSVYEGGGYKNEGLKWYKGDYRPAHLLKPGDVIVTNTEQGFDYLLIGYAAIVPERYGSQGLFSHHIYRIQPKPTSYLPAWFTYLLLRTSPFHEVVAGHSNGTTVNMLPLDGLQKPRFVLPPEEIVKRFGMLFVPTQQQLDCSHDENVTLAALRDALLPKLISGALRVPDAERIVGRAT